MRRYLILLSLTMLFLCCSESIPQGVLSAKKITPILVDLHLAEGIYSQRYTQKITRDNYSEDLYLSVLKKHKVDQKVLEASLLYYGKYPEKYKPIYDEVLNKLHVIESEFHVQDSLRRAKKR
jgi:Domain of unknown function (DUF4296)